MSVEALSIALHHSRAHGAARIILVGIANHDGDGGAWPTVETLAKYAKIKPRSAKRCIQELVELGEVRVEENAGGTRDWRNDRRPNLYHFLLQCPPQCDGSKAHRMPENYTPWGERLEGEDGVPEGAERETCHVPDASDNLPDTQPDGVPHQSPRQTNGVTHRTERGDPQDRHGVTHRSPKPTLNHPYNYGGEPEWGTSPAPEEEKPSPHEDLGGLNVGVSATPRPDRCDFHQAAQNPPPCGACKEARENHQREIREKHREAAQRKREADHRAMLDRIQEISACQLCDEDGYAAGRVCDHDPLRPERIARGVALLRAAIEPSE